MAESRLTDEIVGIGHLPNEVLFLVVARLDLGSLLHFRRTCRRFYAIANDPSWWSDITWVSSGTPCNLKNLKVALKISKKYLKNLSLVCYGKPLRLSKILPNRAYQSIHSISLTNFTYTIRQIKMVLKLPTLIELHMYNSDMLAIFDAVASTKSQLKILSIPQCLFCLRHWADAGYVPPNVRLILPAHACLCDYFKNPMMDYAPLSQVHHEARLSICQPPEFVSLSSLPIAQVCFKPPSMKPFVNCLPDGNDIFPNSFGVIEDSMGSNSGTVYHDFIDRLPSGVDRVYSGVLSGCVTSLHMGFLSTLTSAHLQAIAVSCPNLLHLDLQNSGGCLNDLNGLSAISSFCSKLEILNVDEHHEPILGSVNVDRLWHVIGGMSNLTVLTISCNWIPSGSDHTVLPALKAIHIHGSGCHTNFVDKDFEFFASMPSLRYFRFRRIPSIKIFSGFGNLLHSLTHLTHLYLVMNDYCEDKVTLPTDACCYRNLESFFLCGPCFSFMPDLANAISRCEHLNVLGLEIFSIGVQSVKTLFDSLTSLSTFYVRIKSYDLRDTAKALSICLCKKARREGRIVDVVIESGYKTAPLLNQVQYRMYFTL